MTKQQFLERAREKHGYKYKYPNLPEKIISNDIIDIEHDGVIYKQKVVKHILLGRCPEKNNPKKTQEEFIQQCKEIWGKKYDYSLTVYNGADKKIKIIFDGIIFEQSAKSHLLGMAPEEHMNRDFFIKRAQEKWGKEKYDYSLVDYKHCKEKVKIIHNETGIIYEQTPYLHLCSAPENIKLSIRKTTEQFIIESNIIHNNKYNYDKTDYIKNQIKVIINCPVHGDFNQTPLSHLQGNGCPRCSESRGEREISKFLEKHKISFERQKKFKECKNKFELPFDFYIPSARICIEFDGEQHFSPLPFFGGIDAYERLKINDKIKNDYCEDNYINLVRIRYDQIDDIYQILWENLKNWIKAGNKVN
jgi:very-short-patch-repair endonuclease